MKAKVFYSITEDLIITAVVNKRNKQATLYYNLKNSQDKAEHQDILDNPNVYKEATAWVENRGYRLWSY